MTSTIFARAARDWAEMRQGYETYLRYAYETALEGTGGVLVNKEGRAKHVDGLSLFTGPRKLAEKYASEELLDYWKRFPRLSLEDYERNWVMGNAGYYEAV